MLARPLQRAQVLCQLTDAVQGHMYPALCQLTDAVQGHMYLASKSPCSAPSGVNGPALLWIRPPEPRSVCGPGFSW